MRITAIDTLPVEVALKPEYRMVTALGAHDVSNYLLLRIRTDEGHSGWGEATVSSRWSGETIWGAAALIQEHFRPLLIGLDPHDLDEIERRMEQAARHNWFAKSAVEMACWDLQGKAANQPVYELLGGACRPREIRCRYSLGAYPPRDAAARARQVLEQGFTTIKVKVGTDPKTDVARVRAVREAIGAEPRLMIDANCGWDVETAIRCIRALEDCRLWLVEQPTPDGDYAGMARVRRETEPPVMADDICFDMVHARELIRQECCDVISLYPGKNGGIRRARAIAEMASDHGIACSIGSNLEYEVATAAMAHFVVATENVAVEKYPGDMLGPVYHARRIASPAIQIDGPIVHVPRGPGLGVDVDWDGLAQQE